MKKFWLLCFTIFSLTLAGFLPQPCNADLVYSKKDDITAMNSEVAVLEVSQEAEWLSEWVNANNFIKIKSYPEAIANYTHAIELLSQDGSKELSFGLHNERGSVYLETGELEKAIEDFSQVIKNSDSLTQDLLYAFAKRADAYLRLGEEEKCFHDIGCFSKNNPNFPKITREGNFLVFSNFNTELLPPNELEEYKEMQVNYGLCNSKDDIVFLPGNKHIIKSIPCKKAGLKEVEDFPNETQRDADFRYIQARGKHRHHHHGHKHHHDDEGDEHEKEDRKKEQRRIERCKGVCASIATAGATLCGRMSAVTGSLCAGLVTDLLFECQTCCQEGFDNCAQRFQTFLNKYGSHFFKMDRDSVWE